MKKIVLPGPIRNDIDRDASLNLGLTISLLRVERKKDKKIIPLELHIRWWFWTWRQHIVILV